ncbi:unnamed protein product [Caenorhabditis bovis]|uniref:Activin types I and II receptor domain-containing protein n=1 Tax=Caenorhabditis bovis TaxID=2654633 RepID=A0A8S1FFP8_9PELO|nr:unnamed protein product [Caenorhabditis bovis]
MSRPLLFTIFAIICFPQVFSIECYNGLKLIQGTNVGTATIRCDNSAAYCYNMTASTNVLIDVMKAGCSMWRCMFAQNKCISTNFKGIPISLCCCNTNFCNVPQNNGNGNVIHPQKTGGWNAEPEHTQKVWTKDEVERTFNSAEIDDDETHSTTRAARLTTQNRTETHTLNETTALGDEIEVLL